MSFAQGATEWDHIQESAAYLRRHLGAIAEARVAVVLGSGLGAFASTLSEPTELPYAQIPHFPHSGVEGHAGRLVGGQIAGEPVLVLQGRVHAYEGHSANAIVFAVRTLAALGIRALVLTNAAGAIRQGLQPGEFVLLSDHINLSGLNPAAGPPLGNAPRFFDMTDAYSPRLRALAQQASGSALAEGVYLSVLGPSFETPAEIRAFRALGADLVGMSTALETIAARQAGVEVLGISCVTNLAAGLAAEAISHEEVLETGRTAERLLGTLLSGLIPRAASLFKPGEKP